MLMKEADRRGTSLTSESLTGDGVYDWAVFEACKMIIIYFSILVLRDHVVSIRLAKWFNLNLDKKVYTSFLNMSIHFDRFS